MLSSLPCFHTFCHFATVHLHLATFLIILLLVYVLFSTQVLFDIEVKLFVQHSNELEQVVAVQEVVVT